jgi:hypothetical protein
MKEQHLTAWLHVGHGKRTHGLQEVTGEFQTAKRWLQCFAAHRSRGGSLALAIFSACETIEVAKEFANAGVGVTIGFDKKVPSVACRRLTAEVISAALRANGDRETIIRAFHLGCDKLKAENFRLEPVAFFEKQE